MQTTRKQKHLAQLTYHAKSASIQHRVSSVVSPATCLCIRHDDY